MLSQEALQKILGIEEKVHVTPEEMVGVLTVTFFPHHFEASANVLAFSKQLEVIFKELGVNVIDYNDALERVPLRKRVRRFGKILLGNVLTVFQKTFRLPNTYHYISLSAIGGFVRSTRLKKGVAVIALGEQKVGNLPMEYIRSFKDNSVITILDFPTHIHEKSSFHEHFDTAMNLFAHHMTNIVIAVDDSRWMLYNFNASHPIYSIHKDFKRHVLHALIPKIVAPISPHRFSDFVALKDHFDIHDSFHKDSVNDLVKGALQFATTNLYPAGKKIDDLSFRTSLYRWIGKLHLDNRNGMSFGFLARQLPAKLPSIVSLSSAEKLFGFSVPKERDCVVHNGKLYILLILDGERVCMQVPDVWVLSQRSGSDKTHVVPGKDLVKLGLSAGRMLLQTPRGLSLDNNYRPSFDTKVILAHAVGNAIVAAILKHRNPNDSFAHAVEKDGLGIAHWHGYFDPEQIPEGLYVHGISNPHVACSSPQSAIYALGGKLVVFEEAYKENRPYKGDIHVEPHHGNNVSFISLVALADFLNTNVGASVLGNTYLYRYNTTHGV